MQRPLILVVVSLLAAGASSTMNAVGAGQKAAEKVGDSRSCIPNSSIVSRIVEDERTLRFELLNGRTYRNRLSGPCPGLRQAGNGFGTLGFELNGSSLCQGDVLRVVDPSRGETMTFRTSSACPLGAFERLPDRPRRRR
jgi:hypothetical protein